MARSDPPSARSSMCRPARRSSIEVLVWRRRPPGAGGHPPRGARAVEIRLGRGAPGLPASPKNIRKKSLKPASSAPTVWNSSRTPPSAGRPPGPGSREAANPPGPNGSGLAPSRAGPGASVGVPVRPERCRTACASGGRTEDLVGLVDLLEAPLAAGLAGLASGWYCRASFRKAFLMSAWRRCPAGPRGSCSSP